MARHSGLQVEKSFKFQAKAYPGYRHARTLGIVRGKNGEAGGGWRGEERAARSFVFVRKGEAPPAGLKRSGKGQSSGSEEEVEMDDEEDEFEGFDENEENESWEEEED